jgi:hypothetical protein
MTRPVEIPAQGARCGTPCRLVATGVAAPSRGMSVDVQLDDMPWVDAPPPPTPVPFRSVHRRAGCQRPLLGTTARKAANEDVPSAQGRGGACRGEPCVPRRRRSSCLCSADTGHRTAPRGATSMAATPRPYSTTSRSPCLLRSTPASWASVAMTCSTTSAASTVSGWS